MQSNLKTRLPIMLVMVLLLGNLILLGAQISPADGAKKNPQTASSAKNQAAEREIPKRGPVDKSAIEAGSEIDP